MHLVIQNFFASCGLIVVYKCNTAGARRPVWLSIQCHGQPLTRAGAAPNSWTSLVAACPRRAAIAGLDFTKFELTLRPAVPGGSTATSARPGRCLTVPVADVDVSQQLHLLRWWHYYRLIRIKVSKWPNPQVMAVRQTCYGKCKTKCVTLGLRQATKKRRKASAGVQHEVWSGEMTER